MPWKHSKPGDSTRVHAVNVTKWARSTSGWFPGLTNARDPFSASPSGWAGSDVCAVAHFCLCAFCIHRICRVREVCMSNKRKRVCVEVNMKTVVVTFYVCFDVAECFIVRFRVFFYG